jgi:flavin-binding protein dodecin
MSAPLDQAPPAGLPVMPCSSKLLRKTVAMAKVIEILEEGSSVEEHVQAAASEAAETVRDIKHVYIQDVQAAVEDDRVVKYQVNAKLTFVVEGSAELPRLRRTCP